MSPRSRELNQEMRQRSREAILTAALPLFAEYGFHGTSMMRIATKADVSKGLIYNYFKSKDAILSAVLERWYEDIEQMFSLMQTIPDHRSRIRVFIDMAFQQGEHQLHLWQLYSSIMLQPSVFKHTQKWLTRFFDEYIRQITAEFAALGWPEPEKEARLLAAFIDGIIFHQLLWRNPSWAENLHDYLLERYQLNEE